MALAGFVGLPTSHKLDILLNARPRIESDVHDCERCFTSLLVEARRASLLRLGHVGCVISISHGYRWQIELLVGLPLRVKLLIEVVHEVERLSHIR